MHKAKRQEVEDSMIEVLKYAPHMPGGPKYKVIICVHTYIYIYAYFISSGLSHTNILISKYFLFMN
jgi:hypothetical protein